MVGVVIAFLVSAIRQDDDPLLGASGMLSESIAHAVVRVPFHVRRHGQCRSSCQQNLNILLLIALWSMKHISPRWRLEGQLATSKRLQLECKIPQVAQALFLRSCAFSPGLQTIYPASTSLVIMTLVILLVPPRSCGRMLATLPGRKLDSQAVLPQLSQRHHPDRDAENSLGHHAHPISCIWCDGFLIIMGTADSGQSRGTMGSGLPGLLGCPSAVNVLNHRRGSGNFSA